MPIVGSASALAPGCASPIAGSTSEINIQALPA